MAAKKKPRRRVLDRDRNWRRDLLARDIFTALTIAKHGVSLGPGITEEQIWKSYATTALAAAEQFEQSRKDFKPRSK